MRPNDCSQVQAAFSGYLDGSISGQEMQEMARAFSRIWAEPGKAANAAKINQTATRRNRASDNCVRSKGD